MAGSATTATSTVYQALQSLKVTLPGDLDTETIKPVVMIQSNELVETVGILWKSLKGQHSFLEVLEKEMTRRKTETDIKLKNMQNDLDTGLADQERRRVSEMERMRQDFNKMREEMRETAVVLRKESQEAAEQNKKLVDKTVANIRISLAESQARVSELGKDIQNVRNEVQQLQGVTASLDGRITALANETSRNVSALYDLQSLTPDEVLSAVKRGAQKETLLRTPALQHVMQKIKSLDEKAGDAQKEIKEHADSAHDLGLRVGILEKEIPTFRNFPRQIESAQNMLTSAIQLGDAALGTRIDGLETRFRDALESSDRDPNAKLSHLKEFEERLKKMNLDIDTFTQNMSSKLETKLDADKWNSKADVLYVDTNVNALNTNVESMQAQMHAFQDTLEEVANRRMPSMQRPSVVSLSQPGPAPMKRDSVSSDKVDGLVASLEMLVSRVNKDEDVLADHTHNKVDRDEMNQALGEVIGSLEDMMAQFTQNQQTSLARADDATAGRFRCLSCNREAGPLQDAYLEGAGKKFPPSTMYTSKLEVSPMRASPTHNRDLARPRPHSTTTAVPAKESMQVTSSRKKLMNYYDWLKDKSVDKGPAPVGNRSQSYGGGGASAGTRRESPPREVTPPRSTTPPWDGAQSGGGIPKTRQCGDHGSSDPQGVGSDGRYYVGVQPKQPHVSFQTKPERPRSAPLRRSDTTTPAQPQPQTRADPNASQQ